jgi:hypothetical protein
MRRVRGLRSTFSRTSMKNLRCRRPAEVGSGGAETNLQLYAAAIGNLASVKIA